MLGFYLALMIAIGVFFSRENTSANEMFAAGGRSPWWVAGLSAYMTFFSAGAFVVWGGLAYKYGMIAIVINVTHGIAALLAGYFVAGKWKKIGVRSPAEYIELRFGRGAVGFYTWTMLLVRIMSSAVALYSLAVLVTALAPLPEGAPFRDPSTGNLGTSWALVIFGAIIIGYTMIGGLWAVLMTDVLQFIVILVTVLFTGALILSHAGGLTEFQSAAPAGFFDLTTEEFSLFFLAGWIALHFFQFGAEWAFAQRYISVPRPIDARRAMYLFGGLYIISPIIFFAPPMIYRTLNDSANAEEAYILASALVLPSGMLGMVLAAMFSATASMVSSQLNVFAGVLTTDVYAKRRLQPLSDEEMVRAGRIFTIILGVVITIASIAIPYLGGAEAIVFLMMSLIGPLFAPAVWGLLGRRVGVKELMVAVAVSGALGLFLKAGIAGPALLSEVSVLKPLIGWAEAHPRSLDIYYSVIAPVAALTVMQLVLEKQGLVDPGASRLEDYKAANSATESQPSTLPARVVSAALVLVAISLALLVPINIELWLPLVFACALLLAGAGMMARLGWRRAPDPKEIEPA